MLSTIEIKAVVALFEHAEGVVFSDIGHIVICALNSDSVHCVSPPDRSAGKLSLAEENFLAPFCMNRGGRLTRQGASIVNLLVNTSL